MHILTPTLKRTLPAFALLALCSGVHAQEASSTSASGSSVFSSTSSDSSSDAAGAVNLSLSQPTTSSLSGTGNKALITDVGIGLAGLSLMSLFHGGSSSSASGASGLTANVVPPAVPEASSVISFGLLLTLGLGGLVVTTRKRRTA